MAIFFLGVRRKVICRKRKSFFAKGREKDPEEKNACISFLLVRYHPPSSLSPSTETARSMPCRWRKPCAGPARRKSGGGGGGRRGGSGRRRSLSPVGSTFLFFRGEEERKENFLASNDLPLTEAVDSEWRGGEKRDKTHTRREVRGSERERRSREPRETTRRL